LLLASIVTHEYGSGNIRPSIRSSLYLSEIDTQIACLFPFKPKTPVDVFLKGHPGMGENLQEWQITVNL
jgi:hypothetical protein